MSEIIYLIGLPASGKSTFVEKALKDSQEKDFQIVSTDNIITDYAKRHNISYIQSIWRLQREHVDNILLNGLNDCLCQGKNVIVDRTNLSFEERYLTMRFVPKNYIRKAIIFNIQQDHLRTRLLKREQLTDKHIPDWVVERMRRSFQFPYGREFHEIQQIFN